MDPFTLLSSAAILGGLGLTFGVLIALSHAKLKVWDDPRIDAVNNLLPGINCGACGFPGCRPFAEALIAGDARAAQCTVLGAEETEDVASYLGVEAGEVSQVVARLLCAGTAPVAPWKADYFGVESCAAAVAVGGGGKGCTWGCVGLDDCVVSCHFDAIEMSPLGLPVVDPEKCTACNDCVEACPLDLFVLMRMDHHLIVQCKNLLDGEAATDVCAVACNACRRCVQDAAEGLISIQSNLAVIDYDKVALQSHEAIERCPTNAIIWLEGAQFAVGVSGESTALSAQPRAESPVMS